MLDQVRTFRCPNCNEMISDRMKECPYCKVTLDAAIVELVAERQEKTNRACSDASFLRTSAMAMFVFLGISFIPLLGLAYYGFLITFVAVLVMLIRWQAKFGELITNDEDYKLAKRSRNITLILWLIAIPVGLVARPLFDLLLAEFL
ncbi:MAG: zinc ribbon domain-containing protein [Pyrinomonadaceae bacterium]